MSTEPDFEDFSESLQARYREMTRAVPRVVRAAEEAVSPPRASVEHASAMLAATLDELGAAAEELQAQNEALFAARTEIEAAGQFYRELFDLAPAACLVTTPEARITHVNHAATYLFGRPANALAGRLVVSFVDLPERPAFRAALARALQAATVEEWPIRLLCGGRVATECRVRVGARREDGIVSALQWIVVEDGDGNDDLL